MAAGDPQLTAEGPYDSTGSTVGPVTEFYITDESTYSAATETRAKDIPTQEDTETILAPLQGERDIRASGRVNGLRLANAGVGPNPKQALVNWLIELESLLLPEQGKGYKFTDNQRGETLDPTSEKRGILFEEIRWTYETGDGVNADWRIKGKYAEGFQQADDRSAYISDEKSQSDLENSTFPGDFIRTADESLGFELGEITSRDYARSVDIETQKILHQYSNVPVVGVINSGVTGELNIEGTVSDNDVNLKTFAKQLVDEFHGQDIELYDQATGRVFSGALKDSDTTIESGRPRLMDYRLEIDIGRSIV